MTGPLRRPRLAIGTSTADRLRYYSEPDSNGCHIWSAAIDRGGYGRISVGDRRNALAHRIAYETFIGPIPGDLTVDHICYTPACVNPQHLRLLTNSENASKQRSASKTHCVHGHEYTEATTYVSRQGWRSCRECHRLSEAARRESRAS